MKNLSIVALADDDMTKLNIKAEFTDFTDVQLSFCVYSILKEFYRRRKEPIVIGAEVFLDEVER